MKAIALAVVVGVALISGVASSLVTDALTTEELEYQSQEFTTSMDGKLLQDTDHRSLQYALRGRRHNGNGKAGKGLRVVRGGKSGKSGGKSVKSNTRRSSGKSGKDSDGRDPSEIFYLLPTGCVNQCISSTVNRNSEMANSVVPCDNRDLTQRWTVNTEGSYIKVESLRNRGMCIAVDYEAGDSRNMLREACQNGVLMMKDCDTEYGAEWYFTGGQLVSAVCWSSGISTYMTVDIGKDLRRRQCNSALAVWGDPVDAVRRADTFMFTNTLPNSPFKRYEDDDIRGSDDRFPPGTDDFWPVDDGVWIDDNLPTIAPTMAPTISPTLSPTLSPTEGSVVRVDEVEGLAMGMICITQMGPVQIAVWERQTASWIQDYYEVNFDRITEVKATVTVTAQSDGYTDTRSRNQWSPRDRELQADDSITVTFTTKLRYRTNDPLLRPFLLVVAPFETKGSRNTYVNDYLKAKDIFFDTLCETTRVRTPETLAPTLSPTISPTLAPTISPTITTIEPTLAPTLAPTLGPTISPTLNPTLNPTLEPTLAPTQAPI